MWPFWSPTSSRTIVPESVHVFLLSSLNADMNPLQQHVAGATVRHASPFATLEVPVDTNMLSSELRDAWVRPLYFGLHKTEAQEFIVKNRHFITHDLIAQLLANFDWRSRSVAAYLVVMSDAVEFTTQIGRLLLRSDVCYAGTPYCMALASINTPEAINFLDNYLSYYLKRPDLWFDQGHALAALSYLDKVNSTSRAPKFLSDWSTFIENKTDWNLENSITHFATLMATLTVLKARVA